MVNPPEQSPAGYDEVQSRLAILTSLAHEHLPAPAAEDFVRLLRPALRLEHAREGDPVVAQLGGLPWGRISDWPVWEGHGPLGHVLSFDCAAVASLVPELGLPRTGSLAFFYFDGSYNEDVEGLVGPWDPSSRPGFRVLHVGGPAMTEGSDAGRVPPPPGLEVFPSVALTSVRTMTWPSSETPMVEAVWQRHGLTGPRPGLAAQSVDRLYEALWELPGDGCDTHQIGGHPWPQQGPVELEVEQLRRGLNGEGFEWLDPAVQAAAPFWHLLLQVASDDEAKMMWGDVGQLYYLFHGADRPEDALFTWQCG